MNAIAWSPDGKYLASGNLDSTLTVWEWGYLDPWVMRGFPGKIRSLAWSEPVTAMGAPLLATACVEAVVVWEMHQDKLVGWDGRVLETLDGVVQAIAFQPETFLLASAADDGCVCLWHKAKQLHKFSKAHLMGFPVLHGIPTGINLPPEDKMVNC